jgi:hypothetical protein
MPSKLRVALLGVGAASWVTACGLADEGEAPPSEAGPTAESSLDVSLASDASDASEDGAPKESGAEVRPPAFTYTPSNFNPATYASNVPTTETNMNCNVSYTSPGTAGLSKWCGGTGPYVVPNVALPGAPTSTSCCLAASRSRARSPCAGRIP